ncbi:winged helix-turn-helix transcriptional regulator [uncultured Sphingomonas sp.]|uniref:winged helix-turn-helix transcriptional regulator n=1 Tax=uncultured Sphingomonas sp. TaxID=158754 RepID=UPI0035CA9FDF
MKLEKVTYDGKREAKRWYDDACGTALAMELVGERWSLLIVRELMFGPRRFSEVKAGLNGVSANVLTQRLEGLERAGIVERRQLPSPANAQVYALTPWGRESEAAIQALGRWAVRSPAHDVTLPLSPASMMMSFRTMYPGGGRGRYGFRFGRDVFVARLGETVEVERAEPVEVDAVFEAADPRAVAGAVYAKVSLAELEAAGALRITGDRAAAQRFIELFGLPDKIA